MQINLAGEYQDNAFDFVPVDKPIIMMLFNTCGEMIMRMFESKISERAGCIIGGWTISNKSYLRYADDHTLIAICCDEFQQHVSAIWKHECRFWA